MSPNLSVAAHECTGLLGVHAGEVIAIIEAVIALVAAGTCNLTSPTMTRTSSQIEGRAHMSGMHYPHTKKTGRRMVFGDFLDHVMHCTTTKCIPLFL